MSYRYKLDVLSALKGKGWSTYRLRSEGKLSERTIQNLREGKQITLETLSEICLILECTPNDIIEVYDKEKAPE